MQRPRTKRTLHPFRVHRGAIHLARDVFGLGRTLQDDPGGVLWDLLGLMDGSRTIAALDRNVRAAHPAVGRGEVKRAVQELEAAGIVEDAARAAPLGLSTAERDRYSRNFDFFSLVTLGSPRSSLEIQRRLKAARVTILGVGAVGSAVAASLVAAGVGHLRVLDPDRVELSNLNRQILYRSRDIGRPKAHAAAAHLRELNPNAKITAEVLRVETPADLVPLLRDCDLFVLGADQPHEIMLWANDAAVVEGTPWMENSYSGPRCAIALFVPGRTPCLRCLQHQLVERERRRGVFEGTNLFPNDTSNSVIAPTAGIAGHYGALRALYFLAGLRPDEDGSLIQLNLWQPEDVRVVRPRFWRACPACGPSQRGTPPETGRRGLRGAPRGRLRSAPQRRSP